MSRPPWEQVPTKITSWSYSRYNQYDKCPAQFKYKHIDKLPEPKGPAMERGNHIHKLAEDYTNGLIKEIPNELKLYEKQFNELKKSKPMVEQMWCFTRDWTKTVWNDWSGTWLRIKTDAAALDGDVLDIIDHKTGKVYADNKEQMSLSAMGGMLLFPAIKLVRTHLWYLDSGDYVGEEFKPSELGNLKKEWEKKTKPMLNDTRFAPKPGNSCRWCHFSKSKGGPCKF